MEYDCVCSSWHQWIVLGLQWMQCLIFQGTVCVHNGTLFCIPVLCAHWRRHSTIHLSHIRLQLQDWLTVSVRMEVLIPLDCVTWITLCFIKYTPKWEVFQVLSHNAMVQFILLRKFVFLAGIRWVKWHIGPGKPKPDLTDNSLCRSHNIRYNKNSFSVVSGMKHGQTSATSPLCAHFMKPVQRTHEIGDLKFSWQWRFETVSSGLWCHVGWSHHEVRGSRVLQYYNTTWHHSPEDCGSKHTKTLCQLVRFYCVYKNWSEWCHV